MQESIAENMRKVLPAIDSVRRWTPSLGHSYEQPPPNDADRTEHASPTKDTHPSAPGDADTSAPSKPSTTSPFAKKPDQAALDRLAEESFAIHMRHGGDYIDENPITGRPGEFHLSSTGRKFEAAAVPAPPPPTQQQQAKPAVHTKLADEAKKEGKPDKSPKTPGAPKPKRRKSKMSSAAGSASASAAATPVSGSAATTPAPS